jgi:hypothetical protein
MLLSIVRCSASRAPPAPASHSMSCRHGLGAAAGLDCYAVAAHKHEFAEDATKRSVPSLMAYDQPASMGAPPADITLSDWQLILQVGGSDASSSVQHARISCCPVRARGSDCVQDVFCKLMICYSFLLRG